MKNLISFAVAARISILVFALFILFHLIIFSGFIPENIVLGGRFSSRSELLPFGFVLLLVLFIAMVYTLVRADYLKIPKLAGLTMKKAY